MNLTRKQIGRFREKLQNVPLIQELIDIGREKGREEGRPRGREDRQAVLARRLLWEEVSKAEVGELTGASETMIEAIYTVQDVTELTKEEIESAYEGPQ